METNNIIGMPTIPTIKETIAKKQTKNKQTKTKINVIIVEIIAKTT